MAPTDPKQSSSATLHRPIHHSVYYGAVGPHSRTQLCRYQMQGQLLLLGQMSSHFTLQVSTDAINECSILNWPAFQNTRADTPV